jgi:deoxyhypusine synthase
MPETEQKGKIPSGVRKEVTRPGHQETVPDAPPSPSRLGPIGTFISEHYRHFNAATVVEASEAYVNLLDSGGKMFLAMAGAMSTGELGRSLAEMIRQDKVHAICCTGANLEESLFDLVAHSKYLRIPSYRDLTPEEEEALLDAELARVTDTAIPERDAMNKIEDIVREYWEEADKNGESYFPHEYLYRAIREGRLDEYFDGEPKNCWMLAAAEKDLPITVPGWEDSTLGNMFAAMCMKGEIKNPGCVRGGIEYMIELCDWYVKESKGAGIGFYQIGGGISGDMPICCVPLLKSDMKMEDDCPYWAYFCQISDSTTSYGSYSGAVPNEKLTWMKLTKDTPRFMIESDASIVAPLMFAYVLGW